MNHYYVYITTNPSRTTLYTGITNDLERRLIEHYQNRGNKNTFAGKYYCYELLYFENFPSSYEAIQAEKYIKGKSRKKKEQIIRDKNPSFAFLNRKILGYWPPKYGV
ncbi:MAG TPA: endonuclease [Balneola sp.]|jgi:putative endonuclease|nr:endonuclease [Bacteroidota bacterium]MAC04324.1 endonuclease [Balneola sp.]MAO78339.1 endonuclease [Balneola sp.]MBF64340.1 endonuclease [Balneola sp.]HAH51123.1 endonuclease [Balneola sp.]|tara:strand:- start:4259 stop:4579 length:321 start_codon:yes stop_codon:yes gene_type:complete